MSSKLLNPLANPPNASSSDEEDEEEIVGDTSSEEEEEEEDDVSCRNPTVEKSETEKKQVSDSESDSDEETDSEPEKETKDPAKKPEPSVVTNQESEKVESLATKKRSSETDESTDAKRAKTVSGEETKKNYFQRVWSEPDEIALLQGIIDFNRESGSSPYDDKNVFYERVKKSISFDVSKTQFMEKIRGLKKKFENNLGKGKKKKKKNGEDPTFSKPHDRKAFELSKSVWGDNGIMALESSALKSSKKVESKKQEELARKKTQEFVSIVDSVSRFGVDDHAAKQGWARLAAEDKRRFEGEWKVLQCREFSFYSQKSGFIHELVKKMSEAFQQNP